MSDLLPTAGPLCRVTISTPLGRRIEHAHGRPGDLHAAAMATLGSAEAAVSVVRVTNDDRFAEAETPDWPTSGVEPIACKPAASVEARQQLLRHCRVSLRGQTFAPLGEAA